MLYIHMEINGFRFQAFVDTGAQSTIISKRFCESIGLMKDVDHRFRGVAVGVGTSSIIGRIHTAKLKLENGRTIECSLQVLEHIDIDFLFGIDMMKKFRVHAAHQCHIDLYDNVLKFPLDGFEVPFVKDHLIKRGSSLVSGPAPRDSPSKAPSNRQLTADMEQKISALQEMGADRQKAIGLLEKSAWDVDMAAELYFQRQQ